MVRTLLVTVAVVLAGGAAAYQPYQDPDLMHHRQHYQAQSNNDQQALNYQRQILNWQQTVGQQAGLAPTSQYTYNPWGTRQEALPAQEGGLPPQPTIVAPLPPAQQETSPTFPPTPQPLPEVDNQLGGESTPSPTPSDPLRALCKAPRGQFPGTSCGKFVNCWDDVVVEQNCPLGLYFNENGYYCDYAWNVACKEQPSQQPGGVASPGEVGGPSQTTEPSDLGAPGAKCPTEYGTYRSTKNCGVFYMCVGFVPFEFTCPAGLNFHKDLQVCDYPYRVECNGVPSNQPPPEPTGQPEGETTYPPAPPASTPPPAPLAPSEPAPVSEVPLSPSTPVAATPAQPILVSPEQPLAPLPPPEAYYNLKKVPASLVDSSVPCRANTVYRLNPACSSVAVCRNGYTQVMNCGPGTSYDIYSDRCIPFLRARC